MKPQFLTRKTFSICLVLTRLSRSKCNFTCLSFKYAIRKGKQTPSCLKDKFLCQMQSRDNAYRYIGLISEALEICCRCVHCCSWDTIEHFSLSNEGKENLVGGSQQATVQIGHWSPTFFFPVKKKKKKNQSPTTQCPLEELWRKRILPLSAASHAYSKGLLHNNKLIVITISSYSKLWDHTATST